MLDESNIEISILVNAIGSPEVKVESEHKPGEPPGEHTADEEVSYDQILSMINTDISSQIFTNKVIIPRMVQRFDQTGKRGAIINALNKSYISDKQLLASVYAATKAFAFTLSLGLQQELDKKIDVLTALPNENPIDLLNSDPFKFIPREEAKDVLLEELNFEIRSQINEE